MATKKHESSSSIVQGVPYLAKHNLYRFFGLKRVGCLDSGSWICAVCSCTASIMEPKLMFGCLDPVKIRGMKSFGELEMFPSMLGSYGE